ncbi:MAG TPA: hypothetical protein VFV99_29885 [Kofleriaceae bacterium]|nr:hypothetical protein [Kofleriaceae bacterium]
MRVLAAVLVATLAACAADEGPEMWPAGLGTPDNPLPEDDLTYVVASRIDFTGGGAMPAPVTDAVASMRAFSQNPAKTLLGLADQTQVQQLKSAIGTTLTNSLEGWMNTEIDKARIASKTLRQYATDVVTITETSLTNFYLDSALSMTPAKTTHTLIDLNFRPITVDVVVPMGGFVADKMTQNPTLAVAEGGAMILGDEKFGIAFGDHAWAGINTASTTLYGSGIQTAITTGINCSTLAKNVAAKCSGTSCVGHESQLRAICDGGGAALYGQLRERVVALKLDTIRFTAGTARLVDDHADGIADRIDMGTWQLEMDMGVGLQKLTATFMATAQR